MPKYNVVLKAIRDNSPEGTKAFYYKLATARKQTLKELLDTIKVSKVLWIYKNRENAEQAKKYIKSIGGIAEIKEELVVTPPLLTNYRADMKENTVSTIDEESFMMECPNCGFTQKQSEECIKCGIIFKKYKVREKVARKQEINNAESMDVPYRESPPRRVSWPWYTGGTALVILLLAGVIFFVLSKRIAMKNLFDVTIHDTTRLSFTEEPTHELEFADSDALAFSPDGKQLVAVGANASKEPTLIVWNTATWTKEREVLLQNNISRVAFTPDQKRLVLISGKDEKVYLLDSVTFQFQNVLTAPGIVISFSISPDGKTLATISSSDWKIQLWDMTTQKVSRTLSGQADLTTCIAYSPDGKYLASTGKQVRLWSLATGDLEKTLTRNKDTFAVFFASFSPDSAKLAASCNDSHTRVWDVASGQLIKSFKGEQTNVFSVQFSPDGRTLLTRSMEGFDRSDRTSIFFALAKGSDVCIWNMAARSMVKLNCGVCVMQPHSFAYSPDGKTIVATRGKSIGVWTGSKK